MKPAQPQHPQPGRALPSVRHLPVSLFGAVMSVAGLAPAWLIAGVGSLDIVVTGGALTAGWTLLTA